MIPKFCPGSPVGMGGQQGLSCGKWGEVNDMFCLSCNH